MGYNVKESIEYLENGGIGETMGFIEQYRLQLGAEKMAISADHAMALCILADEALQSRKEAA